MEMFFEQSWLCSTPDLLGAQTLVYSVGLVVVIFAGSLSFNLAIASILLNGIAGLSSPCTNRCHVVGDLQSVT